MWLYNQELEFTFYLILINVYLNSLKEPLASSAQVLSLHTSALGAQNPPQTFLRLFPKQNPCLCLGLVLDPHHSSKKGGAGCQGDQC